MPGFLKSYPDPTLAREALRRSRALRAQSVATPAARPGPRPDTLLFDRVEGQSGRALLAAEPGDLLAPLAALHAARLDALPRFDPLLRVRPRLDLTDDPHLRALAQAQVPQGRATVHGDLHVGQLIRTATGAVWIVDLDDLAQGPPEADLANFAAHLATTDPQTAPRPDPQTDPQTDPGAGIAAQADRICRAWRGRGHRLDPDSFARLLAFALLRRHLKLRAAGRPDYGTEIRAYLRDSASFSIR